MKLFVIETYPVESSAKMMFFYVIETSHSNAVHHVEKEFDASIHTVSVRVAADVVQDLPCGVVAVKGGVA